MSTASTIVAEARASAAAESLCWICKTNKADSGEHKTKRSDLRAVLGSPSQEQPFFYQDLHRLNSPVKSLDAKILKSPKFICAYCNGTRTQPHDRAWEYMSDWLRARQPPLKIGGFVRGDRIFRHFTRREMTKVHLFFTKLFGCMICESVATGHELPIDIGLFSKAIMTGRPHPEVYLRLGKCDGTIGRTNLHCWTTEQGSVLAGWLYELDTIAVSVLYAHNGAWRDRYYAWHPLSGSNRFTVADFRYMKMARDAERKAAQ